MVLLKGLSSKVEDNWNDYATDQHFQHVKAKKNETLRSGT